VAIGWRIGQCTCEQAANRSRPGGDFRLLSAPCLQSGNELGVEHDVDALSVCDS
jgi:hypothetical protein